MSTTLTVLKLRPDRERDQIISYYTLRVLIGTVGMLLPLLLFVGKLLFDHSTRIEFSISDYYDNGTAGDILVGVLFALAFFLFSYKGYAPIDSKAANLGCVFALGVALCPTTSPNDFVHSLHFVFALLLFSVFIFFSLVLFRKSDPVKTRQKDMRNNVYLICGITMIISVLGIAACFFIKSLAPFTLKYHIVFWLESVALFAFGFSWITKAEFLFWKDADKADDQQPAPDKGNAGPVIITSVTG